MKQPRMKNSLACFIQRECVGKEEYDGTGDKVGDCSPENVVLGSRAQRLKPALTRLFAPRVDPLS